jgi:hypothetical protein
LLVLVMLHDLFYFISDCSIWFGWIWQETTFYLLLPQQVVDWYFCCRVGGRILLPYLKRCFISSFMLATFYTSLFCNLVSGPAFDLLGCAWCVFYCL